MKTGEIIRDKNICRDNRRKQGRLYHRGRRQDCGGSANPQDDLHPPRLFFDIIGHNHGGDGRHHRGGDRVDDKIKNDHRLQREQLQVLLGHGVRAEYAVRQVGVA